MDDRFQAMFDKLEAITPSEIMQVMGFTPQRVKVIGENHYKCLCPFPGHQDSNVGSFDVNDSKKIAKCFACQKGGRPIRFFRDLCGLDSDFEAGVRMAAVFGLLSHEEAGKILGDRKNDIVGKSMNNPSYEKPKGRYSKEPPMQPLSVRSTFYETFTKYLPLSSKDRAYLSARGVKDCEMGEFFGYFQKYEDIKSAFDKTQADLKWNDDQYIGIPGMFRVVPLVDRPYVRPIVRKDECIGLKIFNVDGRVVGLQFRNYEASANGERYFWLSSSFVNTPQKQLFHDGKSGDAPAGFQHSTKKSSRSAITITEGKFKAMALAKLGFDSFTIQGVGHWKSVIPELNRYYELHPEKKKEVLLTFDADQKINGSVAASSRSLYDYLVSEGFSVTYLDWELATGKGIDDALANHASIRRVPGEEYIKDYIDPLLQNMEAAKQKRKSQMFSATV